jgi:hypothetical protein
MTPKQELRKLAGERKRLMRRVAKIDIRSGQLTARLEVAKKKEKSK